MKNIINRIATPFFIVSFIVGVITIVYFINKSQNAVYFNASSNVVDIIVGTWVQDDVLYNREVKTLDKSKNFNLSDAYGEIKMIFNSDFTYKSYFNKQIANGEWKIENNLLYMIDHNKKENKNFIDWVEFKYKLNNNELFIYADPWLMALRKK